ncbi:MAG: hypothetical protein QXL24_02150 [Candidatus Jordarchaeaceae archaeon]
MIQVCIVCNKVYGEKEPLSINDYIYGLCLECFEKRIRRDGTELAVDLLQEAFHSMDGGEKKC